MATSSHLSMCLLLCIIGVASATDLVSASVTALSSAIPYPADQLSPGFYNNMCPLALSTIKIAVTAAVLKDPRMGASLLRLHFHDCFVQVSIRIEFDTFKVSGMAFKIE